MNADTFRRFDKIMRFRNRGLDIRARLDAKSRAWRVYFETRNLKGWRKSPLAR